MDKFFTTTVEHLRLRYQALVGSRRRVQQVWEEIENYVAPYRGEFFKRDTAETDVEWRKRWIYDSVPVDSAQTLAASLNGSLTTPLVQWFDMDWRDNRLKEDHEAKEWLEDAVEVMFQELNESNFDLEINELYMDLVAFGNGVIVQEVDGDYTDFKGIDFKSVPIKEVFFEEDYKGRVKFFYRRVFMTPVQIVDRWGPAKAGEDIAVKANSQQGVDEKIEVVQAIYPRDEIIEKFDNGKVDLSKPLAEKLRPYGCKWFVESTAHQLQETGFYEMPAHIVRWRKVSGSRWGFGPAHVAMGDILSLNQTADLIFSGTEKAIEPPILTEDQGIIGDLDIRPRGLTVVRDINGIKPFLTEGRIDYGYLTKDDLRQSIRRIFHVDQLELKESPAMTATEVQVRYELMQRLLGPTMGRLTSDLFDPTIQRTFNICLRAGKFREIPSSVADKAAEMDVEYVGPLSRAQKSDLVANIERGVQDIGAMTELYPEVRYLLDPIKTGREILDLRNVPTSIRRTDAEIDKAKDDDAKRRAMAEQIATAEAGGRAMSSVAEGQNAMQEVTNAGQATAGQGQPQAA